MKNPKSRFITTAISYANGPPHIGHAFEFIIADALTRFYKMKGENTFFLTGKGAAPPLEPRLFLLTQKRDYVKNCYKTTFF